MAKWNDVTFQRGRMDEFFTQQATPVTCDHSIFPDSALVCCLSGTFSVAQISAFLQLRGLSPDPTWEVAFKKDCPTPPGAYRNNMKSWSHWLLPYQHHTLHGLFSEKANAFVDPFTGTGITSVSSLPPRYAVLDLKASWLWVLLPKGYFLVMHDVSGYWKHSSLAAGADVLAAGEIGFLDGQAVWMSLQSGHYMSDVRDNPYKTAELDELKKWLRKVVDRYWSHHKLPEKAPRVRTGNSQDSDQV